MTASRTLVLDSPFLLGFEHTRALIERAAKSSGEGYPPYNVEQTGGDRIRISLAVAGFAPEHLSITVEDRQLVIAGKRDGEDKAYLHRGIAARAFTRTFVLADGMEVEGALLEHGLLHVDVIRPEPERAIKRISIRTAG